MSNRAAPNTADDAIRQTDDDAALSRLSSVNRGLLPDPFAPYFVGFSHPSYSGNSEAGPSRPVQSVQKPVVIDVGTHHRTWAVDKLVESFLHSSAAAHGLTGGDGLDKGGVQVVSLGAGSDTRYFRLMAQKHPPERMRYVEIDFPPVIAPKAALVRSNPRLSALAGLADNATASDPPSPLAIHTDSLTLLPLDLRNEPSTALTSSLSFLDPGLPTLVMAECSLCYMSLDQSSEILRYFSERFDRCMVVVYEMFGLNDQFGRVMLGHMKSRHLTLPGVLPSLPAWTSRLASHGFPVTTAATLWDIRRRHISRRELERVSRLAQLDEVEELRLILEHYCVAWGYKGFANGQIGLGKGEDVPSWWSNMQSDA